MLKKNILKIKFYKYLTRRKNYNVSYKSSFHYYGWLKIHKCSYKKHNINIFNDSNSKKFFNKKLGLNRFRIKQYHSLGLLPLKKK